METQVLKEFLVLCETGNYGKAAERLYISQPVLSRHIAGLEEELGVPLFLRTKRGTKITPYGEEFRAHAQKILAECSEMKRYVREIRRKEEHQLSAAYIFDTFGGSIGKCMEDYARENTDDGDALELQLTDVDYEYLPYVLDRTGSDVAIGFVFPGEPVPEDYEVRILRTDRLCIALRSDSPLSIRAMAGVEDIRQLPLICIDPRQHPYYGKQVSALLEVPESELFLQPYVSSFKDALLRITARGGACLVPENARLHGFDRVRLVHVMDDRFIICEAALWKKWNQNPNIPAVLDKLSGYIF